MKRWALFPVLVLACVAAQADFYRWVDAGGEVRYSDQPPPASIKQFEKIKAEGGKPTEAPLPYVLQQAVKNFPVTLYLIECGDACTRARELLAKRGIEIPVDTHFLGALHNTTTDGIEFFDVDEVPAALRSACQELMSSCAVATKQTQTERLPIVASKSLNELLKRASEASCPLFSSISVSSRAMRPTIRPMRVPLRSF